MFLVRPSEQFLEAACVAAVEAYFLGDGKGDGPKETIGNVWGFRRLHSNEGGIITLDRMHTSLSARRTRNSVTPAPAARHLAEAIVFRFAPALQIVGDFHTHPYSDLAEVNDIKGWTFSEGDFQSFMTDEDLWRDERSTPVMTALTICRMRRVRESEPDFGSSLVQFNLGEFRLWFNVCVGWTDSNGNRRNTTQDGTSDIDATLWLDAYFNPSGMRFEGVSLQRS